MMDSGNRLAIALEFTLKWEGGFVNHPADPGGATNKGVTQKVYDSFRVTKGFPLQSVKAITEAEVHTIYATEYWEKAKCPLIPEDLDTIQFDTAVNMGVARAIKFIQKSTSCWPDGVWGPITAAAVADCDPGATLKSFLDLREAFYKGLVRRRPNMKVFVRGWMNRLNDLRGYVGLAGYESVEVVDFGDAVFIMRLDDMPYEDEDNYF